MAFPSIKIQIGADTSRLNKDLQKGEGLVKSFGHAASRAFDGAVLAAGAFVTKIAIDGVKAASDLNETISKTEVLFGKSAKTVEGWAEANANAMGQTRQQALDAASTFAIFGKQAGYTNDKLVNFSTKFTTLASDMASFSNTSPDEAIQALGAALRGESEPIRKYGVLLSDAAIQAKAYSDAEIAGNKRYFSMQGKKEVLNDQGKLLARYKLILEQTTAAQGDFARTSDGLANGQRILNAQWQDAKLKIGEALLPSIKELVNWANGSDGKKFMNDFATGMADAFKAVAKNLPKIVQDLKALGKTAGAIGLSWDSFGDPRLMAAAAAFRYAPGGIGAKAIAGIAAYAAADYYTEATDPNSALNNVGSGLIGNQQGIRKAFLTSGRDSNQVAAMAWNAYATGNTPKVKGYASFYQPPTVNITVNGATDPVATAKAVSRSLNKAQRMGINTNALGAGS